MNVVVPVLTPDGYNWGRRMGVASGVVVPVLTPDGYNRVSLNPLPD